MGDAGSVVQGRSQVTFAANSGIVGAVLTLEAAGADKLASIWIGPLQHIGPCAYRCLLQTPR